MAEPSPAASPSPLSPQPLRLPVPGGLSMQARQACAGLVYKCLKLTIEGKTKLTPEQRGTLGKSLDEVIAAGQPAFGLAVAAWLRNKKELGNRLISTSLLAACVHREATRPFCRRAAQLAIRLPTDLAELSTEFVDVAQSAKGESDKSACVPMPSCLKKIAKDVIDNLPEFQAGKYDNTNKIKRAKAQLKQTKKTLETLGDRGARNETRRKAAEKRVKALEEKLRKLASGNLKNLVRHTHAGKQHDLNMSILQKRYPDTEEEFEMASMSGTFDPKLCGTRLRVPVPPTWDRELSEKGNVPRTWAELLKAKDDKGRYTLPYMALLRNLRNILLMGLQPSFLRKHVLQRLANRGQIQGSGQTPVSLTHTWTVIEKEFTVDKLQEMKQQSEDGIRDIVAYKCLLKKIRPPILGRSDKLPGIIGEFLGEPVWAPCGLKQKNECFLALNRVVMRGGMMLDGVVGGKGTGKGNIGMILDGVAGGKGQGKGKDGMILDGVASGKGKGKSENGMTLGDYSEGGSGGPVGKDERKDGMTLDGVVGGKGQRKGKDGMILDDGCGGKGEGKGKDGMISDNSSEDSSEDIILDHAAGGKGEGKGKDGAIVDDSSDDDSCGPAGKGKGKGGMTFPVLGGKDGKGKGGKGKGGKGTHGKVDKWLPVALHPATPELLTEFKETFDQAIQVAASSAVEPMSLAGTGPVVLWMDMSNPPLQTGNSTAAGACTPKEGDSPVSERHGAPLKKVLHLAGLQCDHDFITTCDGQECELDEITTHKRVILELRYFARTYIDYNISAFDSSGKTLWNSTYSNTQIRNKHGKNCAVHCRDVGGNPSPTEPALRVLHLDLDALDDEVFAMVVTAQMFSGTRPRAVSIALRECHQGGAERLSGGHDLSNYAPGKVILAQDIGQAMTQGGTTIYSAIYRDVDQPTSWVFRNTLDMSLATETRVARQVEAAAFSVFKQLFQESALKSTMDPATVGYVRLCQLYQALTASTGRGCGSNTEAPRPEVAVVMTGIRKNEKQPSAQVITLTGKYVDDLSTVRKAKQRFSGKAVDADIALELAMAAAGCSSGAVAGLIRIANNAGTPVEKLTEMRKKAGRKFPYGTVDAKGHILDAFTESPHVPRSAVVPGQVESCVAMLRNMLQAMETENDEVDGDELLVRYVDQFFPSGSMVDATNGADVVEKN